MDFFDFASLTIVDLNNYITLCNSYSKTITESHDIDEIYELLNHIMSYNIIVWEADDPNVSSIDQNVLKKYKKDINDIYISIFKNHGLINFIDNTYDSKKRNYIKFMISHYTNTRDNSEFLDQIQTIRNFKNDDWDLLSDNYNKILYIACQSAKKLGSKSLSDYYNKKRISTTNEIYELIRSIFINYNHYTDAEKLMDAIITHNHRNLYTIDNNIDYWKSKTREFYLERIIYILGTFTKVIDIEIINSRIHFKLGEKNHAIILLMNNQFSHSNYFLFENIIYHIIALKHETSFHHELGHVINNIKMLEIDDCVFIAGRNLLGEVAPIVFEYFDGEDVVKYKHENLLQFLMSGFDYYINLYEYNKIPTVFEIIEKFKNYINLIFPNIKTNRLNRPYYLMDKTLIHNTGTTIDYCLDYQFAKNYYENVFKKDINNVNSHIKFAEIFMKHRYLDN